MPNDKWQPLKIKHAAFSPKRGVYLGKNLWSYDKEATKDDTAPTFTSNSEFDNYYKNDGGEEDKLPSDVYLHQVFPDPRDGRATVEQCADAGLPRWGE